MDEQFGGRTDDDLFADDFEPVEPAKTVDSIKPIEPVVTASPVLPLLTQAQTADGASTAPTTPKGNGGRRHRGGRSRAGGTNKTAHGDGQLPAKNALKSVSSPAPAPAPAPVAEAPRGVTAPPPSLAQSRHNLPALAETPESKQQPLPAAKVTIEPVVAASSPPPPPPPPPPNAPRQPKGRNGGQTNGVNAAAKKKENGTSGANATPSPPQTHLAQPTPGAQSLAPAANESKLNGDTPPTAPKAARGKDGAGGAGAQARTQSGANPRTKLTEAELNAKMEAMRLASAEKARRFEQAQRDEQDHSRSVARSQEQARRSKRNAEEDRRRRAVEEEKRRKAAEETRRQDEERARNRDRKLKAMGAKQGNWDEGKDRATIGKLVPWHATGLSAGAGESEPAVDTSRGASAGGPRQPFAGGRYDRGGRGRQFDDQHGNGADVANWLQQQPDPPTMEKQHTDNIGEHGECGPSHEPFPALSGDTSANRTAGPTHAVPTSKPGVKTFSAVAATLETPPKSVPPAAATPAKAIMSSTKAVLPKLPRLQSTTSNWADEVEVEIHSKD